MSISARALRDEKRLRQRESESLQVKLNQRKAREEELAPPLAEVDRRYERLLRESGGLRPGEFGWPKSRKP